MLLVTLATQPPHKAETSIQITAPNSAPTPAVRAMASAPQNVTRRALFINGAPPA